MDARITKSRLANLLSYDWLKIVAAIVAAVLALCVFFTTVRTRPRSNQVFAVYGYRELLAGEGCRGLSKRLLDESIFSYEILSAENETFGNDQYSDTALAARRSTTLGTVMFVTTNEIEATDDDGQTYQTNVLQDLAGGGNGLLCHDADVYFEDCERYLVRFFGEGWEEGELDREKAHACFFARNSSDKRFRTAARREEGARMEEERLFKLREDYLFVKERLDSGLFSYAYVTDDEGVSHAKGILLDGLGSLRNLYYYSGENGEQLTQNICLILFRNDYDAGKPADLVENDLRYEAVSFLRFVAENFS